MGDPSVRLARSTVWAEMPGAGHDLGISPTGNVWAIGTNVVGQNGDFGIHHFKEGVWSSVSGGGIRISVAATEVPWIVNHKGRNIPTDGASWGEDKGREARDIACGAGGEVWVIGTNSVGNGDFGIHCYRGSNDWRSIDGGGVRIAVHPDGMPWVVNAANEVFRRENERWIKLPGKARDIGIGADGSVWIIGTNPVGVDQDFGVFRWTGSDWIGVDGGGRNIAVGPNGSPWLVNSRRAIYRLEENS